MKACDEERHLSFGWRQSENIYIIVAALLPCSLSADQSEWAVGPEERTDGDMGGYNNQRTIYIYVYTAPIRYSDLATQIEHESDRGQFSVGIRRKRLHYDHFVAVVTMTGVRCDSSSARTLRSNKVINLDFWPGSLILWAAVLLTRAISNITRVEVCVPVCVCDDHRSFMGTRI